MNLHQSLLSLKQKKFWLILGLIIITAVVVGGGTYYFIHTKADNDKNNLQAQIDDLNGKLSNANVNANTNLNINANNNTNTAPDPTAGWTEFSLSFANAAIKYPANWPSIKRLDAPADENQVAYYSFDNNPEIESPQRALTEYNIAEWVKSTPEEGYRLYKERKAELLNIVKELFATSSLTEALKTKFNNYSLEFMPYSTRVYVDYFSTVDEKSKGISMINIQGQDVGLASTYNAFIYNSEHNIVVSARKELSAPSIERIRSTVDYSLKGDPLEKSGKDAQDSFANLVKNTPRNQLDFADQMDEVNNILKSLTF
ncbi:MAG: hypothetical protein WC107_01255 [Patescibacteria group bacterium]